ncbi:MAG: hypothetical protein Q7R95_02225 [bacterium]|nr:hypothetical protein [bacterium]
MLKDSNNLFFQQILISLIFGVFGIIISLFFKFNIWRLFVAFIFFGSFTSVLYSGKAVFGEGITKVFSGISAKIIAVLYLIGGILFLVIEHF